jgi:RloB-like protein
VVIADKKRGLDPKSLVDYAIEEFKKEPDFNRVYCVFDKDKHATYDTALNKVNSKHLKGGVAMHAITSVPCFEVWLLLHFTYTTRPYEPTLDESNCALVVADLRRYIPQYDKGSRDFMAYLEGKVDNAIARAKQLEQFHETSGTDNPSTKIHILVEYLQELGKLR